VKLVDFDKIVEELKKYKEYVRSDNFVRTLNDMIRCFAVTGKHDLSLYKFIVENRNWQKNEEVDENEW
jgi:predicted MPP superfamily phosphohydrolase